MLTVLTVQTSIGVNAWALHRNPDVCGANPHTFDPDRWLDDRCDSNMKNAMSFAVSFSVITASRVAIFIVY